MSACTAFRFSHAGKVCSGDYVYKPLTVETRDYKILSLEGQFLEVYVIASWI